MNFLHSLPKGEGSSILEIIITSALIAIGLVGILSLATRSQKSVDFSRDNNIATNYSYQAADWLRDLRNTLGYDTLIYYLQQDSDNPVIYCLNTTPPSSEANFASLVSAPCSSSNFITDTIFSREISINLSDINSGFITGLVTTSWEGNKTYTNTLETKLSKWQ